MERVDIMGFDNFVGQEKAVEIFKRGLSRKKLNHAYLLYGSEERGKLTFAFLAARAINCLNSQEDACGDCVSCQKIEKGLHPDVTIISPQGNNIKIEQLRQAKAQASYRPNEGEKKVIVIKEAHLMSLPAANSLLKILEEPPFYLVFILITSDLALMPYTIVSRCQLVPFNQVPANEIFQFLKEHEQLGSFPEEQLKTSATLADGSIGQAIKIVSSTEWQERRKRYFQISRDIVLNSDTDIFSCIEELMEEEKILDFFDFLESILRDCLVYQSTEEESLIINIDYLQEIKGIKNKSYRKLLKMIREVERFKKNSGLPLNKRLALEALLVKLKG